MNAEDLKDVLTWIKTTDLTEVTLKKGEDGFSFSLPGSAPAIPEPDISSRYAAVVSPGVGIFQWGEPGRAAVLEEGAAVKEGAVLGRVEQGPKASLPVKAPVSGRLAKIFIEEGKPADYGRLLFFIET